MESNDSQPLTLTIPQAAKALGISRALAYDLARQGKLPVLRLGEKRMVVPRLALKKMLAEAGGGKSGGSLRKGAGIDACGSVDIRELVATHPDQYSELLQAAQEIARAMPSDSLGEAQGRIMQGQVIEGARPGR